MPQKITHDEYAATIIGEFRELINGQKDWDAQIEFLGVEPLGGDAFSMLFKVNKYGHSVWYEEWHPPLQPNAHHAPLPPNYTGRRMEFHEQHIAVPSSGAPERPWTKREMARYYFLGSGWRFGIMRMLISRSIMQQIPKMIASYIYMYFASQMMQARHIQTKTFENEIYPMRSRNVADWGIGE